MVEQLKFISQENWPGFPPANRRHKQRVFYCWELLSFSHHNRYNEFQVDSFPSSPAEHGIQSIKDRILSLLKNNDVFDFSYMPKELDFLKIECVKNRNEYLNLTFINGEWTEEYFLFTKRDYFDTYLLYKTGYLEIV